VPEQLCIDVCACQVTCSPHRALSCSDASRNDIEVVVRVASIKPPGCFGFSLQSVLTLGASSGLGRGLTVPAIHMFQVCMSAEEGQN